MPGTTITVNTTTDTGVRLSSHSPVYLNVTSTGILNPPQFSYPVMSYYGSRWVIDNAGTINSGAYREGVALDSLTSTTIINQAGGLITGTYAGVYVQDDGNAKVSNAGSIAGVNIRAGYGYPTTPGYIVNLTNLAGGTIYGQANGVTVRYASIAHVTNAGFIGTNGVLGAQNAYSSISSNGVYDFFATMAVVTNLAGGTIAGVWGGAGVNQFETQFGTVANKGLIEGGRYGVAQNEMTSGTVTNLAGATIYANVYGVGIAQTNVTTAQITNAGTIAAGTPVQFIDSGVTIHNELGGKILADNTGYNQGIYGRVNAGDPAVTIINNGTISGNTGVYLVGSAPGTAVTILNEGVISGYVGYTKFSGYAVADLSGPLLLGVTPKAQFKGGVYAAKGASNTLELMKGVAPSGTITGIGTQFQNFATIAIDAQAQWTLVGNSAGLAAGQQITGFLSGDEIGLTGVAATSESFASGTLTLYGPGAVIDAKLLLPEAASITSANFSLTADNGGVLINFVTPSGTGMVLPSHV